MTSSSWLRRRSGHFAEGWLGVAVAVLIAGTLAFGAMPLLAQTDPGHPTSESLTYSEWCRYMDSLKAQRTRLGWRALLDVGVELLGTVAFFVEMAQPTPNLTRVAVSLAISLAGAIDFFAYTAPRQGVVVSEMLLFKTTGAARMWVWPCSDTRPSW